MTTHHLRTLIIDLCQTTEKGIEFSADKAKKLGYTDKVIKQIQHIFSTNKEDPKYLQFLKTLISTIHGDPVSIYHIPKLKLIYCYDKKIGVFYIYEEALLANIENINITKYWQIV